MEVNYCRCSVCGCHTNEKKSETCLICDKYVCRGCCTTINYMCKACEVNSRSSTPCYCTDSIKSTRNKFSGRRDDKNNLHFCHKCITKELAAARSRLR